MKKLTLFFFLLTLAIYGQTPCSPISTLDCSDIVVGLPYNLDFSASTSNTIADATGSGTGFTAVMEHSEARISADLPISNPNVNGYEPSLLTLTGGTLQLVSQKGIAYLNPPSSYRNNTQVNTLGVGLQNITTPITIKTTLLNLVTGSGSAQSGLWFGYDEDNFVKLDIDNNNVEMRVESNGVSTNNRSINVGASGNNVTLELVIDPNTLTAMGYYIIGSGAKTLLETFSIPADYISGRTIGASNVTFAGIYTTHRNGNQYTATYDSFSVSGPADTQSPTAPSLSNASNTDTSVNLSWTAATDNVGVTGYNVFINGTLDATLGNVLTYQKTGLTASTTYNFTVVALDASGNESSSSNEIQVTTNAPTSTGDPTAPLLSSSNKTDTTVSLNWTAASSSTSISGYKVYKDGILETTLGNILEYQSTSLAANTSYKFTVTAINSTSNESVLSNEVFITTNSSSGGSNTTLGEGTGNQGSNNVFIGKGAGQNEARSNKLYISNSNTNNPLIYGDFAKNEARIGGDLFLLDYKLKRQPIGAYMSRENSSNLPDGGYGFKVDKYTKDGTFADGIKLVSLLVEDEAESITGIQLNATNSAIVIGSWVGYERNKGYGLINRFKTKLENDLYLSSGKIGIGVESSLIPAEYDLAVAGKIISEEVKVQLRGSTGTWPDYVFANNYKLPSLTEVEAYIKAKGHLKNIPSAIEVSKNGILLGDINAKLLEKIEELTLYTIQQQKALETQNQKNKTLEARLAKLEMLLETIGK